MHSKAPLFAIAAMLAAAANACTSKPPASPEDLEGGALGFLDSSAAGDGTDDGSVDQVVQSDSPSGDASAVADAPGTGDAGGTVDATASDAGSASGNACSAPSDCRTYSDYCGGCTCYAIGASASDPTCDAAVD